jgi:hypothetical protein
MDFTQLAVHVILNVVTVLLTLQASNVMMGILMILMDVLQIAKSA